jgi:hypothetical protein
LISSESPQVWSVTALHLLRHRYMGLIFNSSLEKNNRSFANIAFCSTLEKNFKVIRIVTFNSNSPMITGFFCSSSGFSYTNLGKRNIPLFVAYLFGIPKLLGWSPSSLLSQKILLPTYLNKNFTNLQLFYLCSLFS